MQHSEIIISPLLVPGGNAPTLFEPVNQPFNAVAQPITGLVKGTLAPLIRASRNRVPHVTLPQIGANVIGTVRFVAHQSVRAQFGAPGAGSVDGALLHQGLEGNGFMALTGGQDEGYRLTAPLTAHVHLGGKATTGVA